MTIGARLLLSDATGIVQFASAFESFSKLTAMSNGQLKNRGGTTSKNKAPEFKYHKKTRYLRIRTASEILCKNASWSCLNRNLLHSYFEFD